MEVGPLLAARPQGLAHSPGLLLPTSNTQRIFLGIQSQKTEDGGQRSSLWAKTIHVFVSSDRHKQKFKGRKIIHSSFLKGVLSI
jgi:hypothetical protein